MPNEQSTENPACPGLTDAERTRLHRYLDQNARPPGQRDGYPDGPDAALRPYYDDEADEMAEAIERRDTSWAAVSAAHGALLTGDRHLTSHEEAIEKSGLGYHECRKAAAVLSDVGGIHECYDDDWNLWWVRCDEYIQSLCKERRISLYRYYAMRELLNEFQNHVIDWFVRRNRRHAQNFKLSSLKAEYVHTIQEEWFPDKPVGEEWSSHIAARYLRTAQDSIMRSYALTY